MSKLLKVVILASSLIGFGVQAASMGKNCDKLLFKALTVNHKKEVKVCLFAQGGQNYVKYRFGKVGETPELSITARAKDTRYIYAHGADYSVNQIIIYNGKYQYSVAYGMGDTGEESAEIDVRHKDKQIAEIPLDLKTLEHNIYWDLENYGMVDDMKS